MKRFLVLLSALLLLGGCAGYRLGDTVAPPFQTIHVETPVNESLAPQSAALLGAAIRHELDRSGRVRLAAKGEAESSLAVTLTGLRREISADRSDDTTLARKWRLTLTTRCTLLDPRTGRAFFTDREISAFDEVYADSGQTAAEYQHMPALTARLGAAIAREVLGVW